MRFLSWMSITAAALLVAAWATCEEPDLGWARENASRGRYSEAIKQYREAITAGAGIDAKVELSKLLVTTGKYKDARELTGKAAKAHPESSAIHCALGEALVELGQYEKAVEAFGESLRLDKKNMAARWGLVTVLETLGRTDEAYELKGWYFDYYEKNDVEKSSELAYIGLAAMAEDPKEAFRLLGTAMKGDAANVHAAISRGYLSLERYSFGHAASAFRKVLKRNPNHPMANLGMGHVSLASNKNDDATKSVEKALKVNPDLVPALLMMATLALIDEDFSGTPEQIEKAIAVNPNSLEALSMRAAFANIAGDLAKRDDAIRKVLALNPSYSELYITLSKASERKRNIPDAVRWGRKAMEMAPEDWQGHFAVSMNLLRMGREKEGYRILETAFKLNKFNVWARNMLVCLDKDFRKGEYVSLTTDHFVIKMHKSEVDILGPYATVELEKMYADLTAKYKFRPIGTQDGERLLVSFFPEHADFSARTVGLPGLSALGACMGQLVTMPSPKVGVERGPKGMFNWIRVLEHEFTHVVTLQMTRYKIPRWLTEGISVWEEADPQLKWDMPFKMALVNGQLLPLADINRGFTRPKQPGQVAVSYYQAGLFVGWLVETHGMDALVRMCSMYRDGDKTPGILLSVTGKTIDKVDAELDEYMKAYVERVLKSAVLPPPAKVAELAKKIESSRRDYASREALAAAYLAAGRVKDARKLAEEAVKIRPRTARANNVLGYIALKIDKDQAAAEKRFAVAARAKDDWYGSFALGHLLAKDGKVKRALPLLEKSIKVHPRNTSTNNIARQNPYRLLGGLYEDAKRPRDAMRVYRLAFDLDHSDYHSARRLGTLLAEAGSHAEALSAFERCFQINPFQADTHLSAGEAAGAAGNLDAALREFRIARKLDSRSFPSAMGLARTCKAKELKDEARKAAEAAVELEPDDAEAKALRDSLK